MTLLGKMGAVFWRKSKKIGSWNAEKRIWFALFEIEVVEFSKAKS